MRSGSKVYPVAARWGGIRFSFGKPTVRDDVDDLFEHPPKLLNQRLDLKAA